MRVATGHATHVGRVRADNEDSYALAADVFVVADGMGGHAAGEVASFLAAQYFQQDAAPRPLTPDSVVGLVAQANADILASAASHSEQAGMGTTLAGLAVVSLDGVEQWAVFNVGDSRVYRFSGGQLSQISQDHSMVAELAATGQLTDEQARIHPMRNVVTRSLGSDPAPQADVWLLPPVPHDRFLICSDGLSTEVEDEQIAQILATVTDPQAAADQLVSLALDAGGRDNVTVLVIELRGADDPE